MKERSIYQKVLLATQRDSRGMGRQDLDAYFAGFFDGEGHITVSRDVRRPWSCYVEIGATQNVLTPLHMLQKCYGGKVHLKHRGKLDVSKCSVWRCSGKDAMYALYRMLPWLVVKQEKARVALIVLQNRPLKESGGQISPHQKMAISKALAKIKVVERGKKCQLDVNQAPVLDANSIPTAQISPL